jgi:hypothetical protein
MAVGVLQGHVATALAGGDDELSDEEAIEAFLAPLREVRLFLG